MSTGIYTKRRMIAPEGGVVKGTAYLIGAVLVIARSNAAEAAYFTAAFGGRWTLTKTSAQAWTAGQRIYWNTSTSKADSDSSTGPMIGHAALIAANPSTTGSVDLTGVPAGTAEGGGLDTTELGLLNGATAGSVTASKVASRDAGKRLPIEYATVAAAGNAAGNAAAITAQYTRVTAADGTKGVILPVAAANLVMIVENGVAGSGLKVYPDTGGAINGGSANAAVVVGGGQRAIFVATAALTWIVAPNDLLSLLTGVAAGYKIARGQHTTVDEDDTVVTGLTTVVAAVASLESDPVAGAQFVTCAIGNQAGAPAAGSIQIKTWKATAAGDTALIAASTFSKLVNWIAIGT